MTLTKFPETKVASGNLHAEETVEMSFDPAALKYLIHTMTNLYSNPYLAVLREYSTNALDSHVTAGQTEPIQVTLPSSLNPLFKVQDYGTGMSKQEIIDCFRYGASTKRNDLNQVGAFGLGSKCALALVDQFTFVGVKNGEKTVAVVSRGEAIHIVSTSDVDEPNGVTVTVAIPSSVRFNENVESFFRSWKPGTVMVDGKQPESIYDSQYLIKDNIHVNKNSKSNNLQLVVGGIAYSVKETNNNAYSRSMYLNNIGDVYIHAPIGSVDLVPSRESLLFSKRTKDYIESAYEGLIERKQELAQADIHRQETPHGALKAYYSWLEVVNSEEVTWNGIPLKSTLYPETKFYYTPMWERRKAEGKTSLGLPLHNTIYRGNHNQDENKIVIITGATDRDLSVIRNAFRLVFKTEMEAINDDRTLTFVYTEEDLKIDTPLLLKNDAVLRIMTVVELFAEATEKRRATRAVNANKPKAPKEKKAVTPYLVLKHDPKTDDFTYEDVNPDGLPAKFTFVRYSEYFNAGTRYYRGNPLDTQSIKRVFDRTMTPVDMEIVVLRNAQRPDTLEKRVRDLYVETKRDVMSGHDRRRSQIETYRSSLDDKGLAVLQLINRHNFESGRPLRVLYHLSFTAEKSIKDPALAALLSDVKNGFDLHRKMTKSNTTIDLYQVLIGAEKSPKIDWLMKQIKQVLKKYSMLTLINIDNRNAHEHIPVVVDYINQIHSVKSK